MREIYEALKLEEAITDLSQGVFWIVDLENLDNNEDYCFLIFCDADGNNLRINNEYELNAKSGDTYNHEALWKKLPKSLTFGKAFDYYPRGRVQIANQKAIVYLNPNINTEDVQTFIKNEFNLHTINGLKEVTFKSDGSEHYRCYLDDED